MKYLAFFVAVFLQIAALAQTTEPVKSDPWRALAFLEGSWIANVSDGRGVSAAGTYVFRTELGDHILARHSTPKNGCTGPTTFDCDHGDLLYVYRDSPDGPLRAIYFDNEGHVIHYDVRTPNPTTAEFLSDPSQPGPRFRLTYHRDAEMMTGRFEVRAPGQDAWNSYLQWSGPSAEVTPH